MTITMTNNFSDLPLAQTLPPFLQPTLSDTDGTPNRRDHTATALRRGRLSQSAKNDTAALSKAEVDSYTSSESQRKTSIAMPQDSTPPTHQDASATKQPAKPAKPVDAILHGLAANRELTTKKAVREALREAGLPGRPASIDQVFANRKEHDKQRWARNTRRALKRTGKECPARPQTSAQTKPVLLPSGTPHERINAKRRATLKSVAVNLLRYGAAGGSSFNVVFSNDPSKIGYIVDMGCNWDTYGGSFKGWRANEDDHSVTIPHQWLTRVYRRDLEELSGLLTLDAIPVSSGFSDIELYKAVWARQGRGFAVITERGFIARCGDFDYHADTAEKALSGIRRKMTAAGERAKPRSPLAITDEEFIKRFSRRDKDCTVSLDDARESGSCESGILQWCEAVGIDPSRGSIPLHEALEAFSREPQTEVRLAIIHASRRHRREKRLAAKTGE